MRERELKQESRGKPRWSLASLPMRERELKLPEHPLRDARVGVAPHAGA